jgi:Family of unknown function (DUF6011)
MATYDHEHDLVKLSEIDQRSATDPSVNPESHGQTDQDFKAWTRAHMREQEVQWRAANQVFSWIDPEPVWISTGDWYDYGIGGFPPEPEAPCDRIYRFSLIDGGQIRVTEEWRLRLLGESCDPALLCNLRPRLVVTAHVNDKLCRCTGHLERLGSEMDPRAVVMAPRTPQEIADRTAATLRAIDRKSEHFHALLDGSKGCAICGRPLRDEVSKLVGVGPDCASTHSVPHNMTAASARLALRRKLLEIVMPMRV